MQYRKFGKMDFKVSALGFGAMRLPMNEGAKDDKDFNEQEAIRIIRRAIDSGVNYIDSAYIYHGGLSEVVVGKALKDGYRQKVKIATKFPVGFAKTEADFDRILDEQLKRLDDTHIDFYMFHGIGDGGLKEIQDKNFFKKIEAAKADGRIGHIGFSFHDTNEAFTRVVDAYDKWEFCQIQYNYMDTENQAGVKGLKYAGAKGIAVIIMEPLLGGRLARPPKSIQNIIDAYKTKKTGAEWALQWIWNQPEVTMILSGMSAMQQVEDNIVYAGRSGVNLLSAEEVKLVETIRDGFRQRAVIPCTKCNYCMPCPSGVNIPHNFALYNEGLVYEDPGAPRFTYERWTDPKERANQCTQCKICEEKCPQKIEISDWMPKVHAVLGEGKDY
ncbi:MAG: aldo/keto reductase [bacterium]